MKWKNVKVKVNTHNPRIKYTTETFICKASAIHNNKYFYPNLTYTKGRDKITVVCTKHGPFLQTAESHLRGQGCKLCYYDRTRERLTSTREQFVEKSNIVHNNKYLYDKVEYTSSATKVKITCNKHGVFLCTPNNHTQGYGCSKCKGEAHALRTSLSLDEFMQRAFIVHGNRYDYSQVTTIENCMTKVRIMCKVHGEFFQTPNNHLNNEQGCVECGRLIGRVKRTNTKNYFIEQSKIRHAGTYNYTLSDYIRCHQPVKIECGVHGVFMQLPYAHMQGHGCPACKESKGERIIRHWLSTNRITFKSQHTFNDCVNNLTNTKLKFDFFLPDNNMVIEYDGKHHFEPVCFGGRSMEEAERELIITQQHDIIKNEYCKKNSIILIRIPFYKKNDLVSILESTIKII